MFNPYLSIVNCILADEVNRPHMPEIGRGGTEPLSYLYFCLYEPYFLRRVAHSKLDLKVSPEYGHTSVG